MLQPASLVIAENPGKFGMIVAKPFEMFAELAAAVFGGRDVIRKQFRPVEDVRKHFCLVALGQMPGFDEHSMESAGRLDNVRI